MDIAKLDLQDVERVGSAYLFAKSRFSKDPSAASPAKQKKIRKFIKKFAFSEDSFSEEVSSLVSDTQSDAEFLEFAAECAEYINGQHELKRRLFEQATKVFPEDTQQAFTYLYNKILSVDCRNIEKQGNKFIISFDETDVYKRKLVLNTSADIRIPDNGDLFFCDAELKKSDSGYVLICKANDYDEETAGDPLEIPFGSAETEVEIYNIDSALFYSSPWEYLFSVANMILEKKDLGEKYFNEKEKELIPLLTELRDIYDYTPESEKIPDFRILKEYMRKYGFTHLIPLFDKVIKRRKKQISQTFAINGLLNKLNDSKCEELWREIYEKIKASQEEYSAKVDFSKSERLSKIRKEIEKRFHEIGYEGEYPTFRKRGQIKGVKLESNYGISYFLCNEKHVEFIVECKETVLFGTVAVQFICGTALLKKGETAADIYSCCFNKNGKRLFKTEIWDNDNENAIIPFTEIAVKRAECIKLTKDEKLRLGKNYSFGYFFFMFLFTGGLLAVSMTVIAVILTCLVTAILVGVGDIPEMLAQMPWLLFFMIGFVGFGLSMAVMDFKSQNK